VLNMIQDNMIQYTAMQRQQCTSCYHHLITYIRPFNPAQASADHHSKLYTARFLCCSMDKTRVTAQ
jgi:hypothetical protein